MGNLASCRIIFVTPNAILQKQAADFLTRKKFVLKGEITPIVTSRYISGLCWLMCGGKSNQSPTIARLLANCAAALRLKPELAERTKRFLAEIDPEKARHFEVLMTNERASQYLVEATLGDINVITANNVEDIYEEVQRRAAEKVAIEKDTEYKSKITDLESRVQEEEKAAKILKEELIEKQLEANTKKMELEILSDRAAHLEEKQIDSVARIAQQELKIKELSRVSEQASEAAANVQSQLAQQWQQGRTLAMRHAEKWTKLIRAGGIILFAALSFGSTYIDKYITPEASPENQKALNIIVMIIPVILGCASLGLIFERLIQRPIDKIKSALYNNRLAELGIPADPSPPSTTGNQTTNSP